MWVGVLIEIFCSTEIDRCQVRRRNFLARIDCGRRQHRLVVAAAAGMPASARVVDRTRMQLPPQITFVDVPHSDSVEAVILEKIAKLQEFHSRIVACRVAVSQQCARGRNGHLYQVRVEVTIPGAKDIVASRDPGVDHSHENVLVAVRDAFDAARRQLDEHAARHSSKAPSGNWPAL
jgi:ribosome-associated translation inhibitor RaiA